MTAATRSGGGSTFGWLAVLAAAIVLLLAFERLGGEHGAIDSAIRQPSAPNYVLAGLPADYDALIAGLDASLADARDRAAKHDDQWLMHERLAGVLYARARLSGSFDDYAAAGAALDRAFAVAAPRTGPHMMRAVFDFTMHRLGATERQLALIDGYAIPDGAGDRAEAAAMRGDIALYRGDYAGALARYDDADRIMPGTADFRRAIYHFKTGDIARADAWFDRLDRKLIHRTPSAIADLELQRGILELERGRWDAALARFRRAQASLPGYWLIDEHIAEVTALKGDPTAAERMYRDVVARTGNPEFMDALADLAAARDDARAASQWRGRAARIWQRRLRQFPEAAYGHALGHCEAAERWECALDLARRNHAARPHGDAKIALAHALLHNDRAAEARAVIAGVLASPWRTAELHKVAAEIYTAFGDAAAAQAQRQLALSLNPHALDGGWHG